MDEELQSIMINALQESGPVVIANSRPDKEADAMHHSMLPPQSMEQWTADKPRKQHLETYRPKASELPEAASEATPVTDEASPAAKADRPEMSPPASASQIPHIKAADLEGPLSYLQAVKAITATNNAYSGFIESQDRLRKHQERINDDQTINQVRANMAPFPPRPLADDVEVNAEPPIDVLPQPAADLISALSAHFGPAPEMPLVVLLGVMFIAARGTYIIRVGPQHTEALTGYFVGAAASGQRKSAIVGYFRTFFDEVERELRSSHAKEGRETAHELSQFALKQIKAKLADDFTAVAETAGITHAQSAFSGQISALDRLAKSIRIAKHEPRLLTDLTTPEALAEDLERQGEAIGILVAEGGYWKRLIAKYDDLPLRAFTGEPFSSSTRSVASIHLRTPIMAICTLVQPDVLNSLFGNAELAAHGLTARILPVYIPSRKSGGAGPEIPDALAHWLRERIHTLLRVKRADTSEGMPVPYVIDIDDQGKAHIARYQAKIKAELAAGRFDHFQPFVDKLVGHAIRLAGAIHLLKHSDPRNHLIDAQSIVAGIALAEFFRQHADVAFTLEKREGGAFARKILACIVQDPSLFRFSPRDVQRRIHGARAHQVQAGLTILERHGFVYRFVRNGRIDYIVHPNAHWWL